MHSFLRSIACPARTLSPEVIEFRPLSLSKCTEIVEGSRCDFRVVTILKIKIMRCLIKNLKCILLSVLVFFFAESQAQENNLKSLKNWELKGYAADADKKGDAYSAVNYLKEYVKRKPNDLQQTYLLAQLYMKVRDYQNAQNTFSRVYQTKPEKYIDALFYSAILNKNLGKYNEAYSEFTLYEKQTKKDKLDKTKLRNEISGCRLALRLKDTLVSTEIIHLDTSINKPHIEFSPLILNDSAFVYGSSEIDKLKYYSIEEKTNSPFRKFLMAKMNKDSIWIKSESVVAPFVNYSDAHTGNGIFSLDKKRFYAVRCSENWEYKMICTLYASELKEGVWQVPVALNNTINNPEFTSTQPAVGTCYIDNLEVIYFSSDRPGGMGGHDIWYTVYNPQNNAYTKALNAGMSINTAGDEITPFFDMETHSLFFSSNGWPCLGGLDVFRSFGDLMTWSQPENIGYPVNSGYDDLFFSNGKDHKYGFFTSNRIGSISLIHENCCDDIYYFKQIKGEKISVSGKLVLNDISKEISNKKANRKDSVELKKLQRKGVVSLYLIDEKSEPIFIAKDSTNYQGEFSFNVIKNKEYKVIIEDERVIDNSFLFNTINENNIKIVLDSIQVKIIPDQPIVIENIYYEFDKYDLTNETKSYLDSTLIVFFQKYSNLEIEIRSHTDNKGTDEYNMILSQKRSESVIQYLIEKGIEKERLTAIGFGAKFPVAENLNVDGSDNPEGRKKNRRTEFKITRKIE